MTDQTDFDKNALRKLAEKYLTTTILQNDILGFLKENIPSKQLERSISSLLAERSGKSANTVYKNINELGIYNAISLLRYWQAMTDICIEFQIDEIKIPNLNSLLLNYEEILRFINHITIEDQLEVLIKNNLIAIMDIIIFYESHGASNTTSEKNLLLHLTSDPRVTKILKDRQQLHKESILVRMKKK